MASVMKNDGKNDMADEAERSEGSDEKPLVRKDEASREPTASAVSKPSGGPSRGGFFTIYKKGQGYWTRMGTVGGAALIAALTAQFLYSRGRIWFQTNSKPNMPAVLTLVGSFVALFAFVVYRVINKPTVADFLIATDSEMKKVNWTTRAELIGSTKVVIVFMFLIAFILFGFDTIFGYFFWFINVLVVKPF
jgi:preprotein translocase subunit SecE